MNLKRFLVVGLLLSSVAAVASMIETTPAPSASVNVLGTALTGYSSTTGSISASDTVLTAIDKLNGNTAAITYTAGQFPAATTGTNATAGNVGVFFSSTGVNGGSPSGSYEDIVTITLPAGDWDTTVTGHLDPSGSTVADFIIGISTTSGNSGAGLVEAYSKQTGGAIALVNTNVSLPRVRFNFTTPTPVYCKSYNDWTGGSGVSVRCGITARSVR